MMRSTPDTDARAFRAAGAGRLVRNVVAIALGAYLLVQVGCDNGSAGVPAGGDGIEQESYSSSPLGDVKTSGQLLTDVTLAIGIRNPIGPWPDGQYMTPEITPGGVALLDYDNDGRLDIYQVCHCPPGSFSEPAPNRLYRQQPDGSFVEVAGAAGLDDPGFGHGVAVGDTDNDGDLDVYVTNYGPDAFFINNGDGTYRNATSAAGFSGDHWSSSAAFLDYDRDGDLDLYVVRFARFDPRKICKGQADDSERDYCGPHMFDGELDALYRNNGDGTFSDVTRAAGITAPGRGWGIVCADLTGDGWIDVYIANDEEPAQLWVNGGDGTFADEAVIRNVAFNGHGRVEAGMGVAAGDVSGDGLLDLLKTHITSETNTLFVAVEEGLYVDETANAGMAAVDRPFTGWGCGLVDFDHDGDLDAAVVNGRVSRGQVLPGANLSPFWNRFAEPKFLFANEGRGRFTDVSGQTGQFGSRLEVSRGLAMGDLDDDGDVDFVVNNLDNTLRVYRNDAPAAGAHWLKVRAMVGKRDAYGAELSLVAGGRKLVRVAHPAYSFLSSNDPSVHFGLGAANDVRSLEITWPDGAREQFEVPGVDRQLVLRQGGGTAL